MDFNVAERTNIQFKMSIQKYKSYRTHQHRDKQSDLTYRDDNHTVRVPQ